MVIRAAIREPECVREDGLGRDDVSAGDRSVVGLANDEHDADPRAIASLRQPVEDLVRARILAVDDDDPRQRDVDPCEQLVEVVHPHVLAAKRPARTGNGREDHCIVRDHDHFTPPSHAFRRGVRHLHSPVQQ
jgi:hypothetical protein